MKVTLTIETTDAKVKAQEYEIEKVVMGALDRTIEYYLHVPEKQDIAEMIRENLEVKVVWEK